MWSPLTFSLFFQKKIIIISHYSSLNVSVIWIVLVFRFPAQILPSCGVLENELCLSKQQTTGRNSVWAYQQPYKCAICCTP